MMGVVLAAESVGKAFRGRTVLQSVYLGVEAGVVTALLGRNGSGKTTLLRILAGELRPDYGVVRFSGTVSHGLRLHELARQGLFYLPARGLLARSLRVGEQLTAVERRFRARRVQDACERLNLGHELRQRPQELSPGQVRRAEFAAAYLRRPRCFMADEPFRGIAPRDQESMGGILREMAGTGCALLFTAHEFEAVAGIADRILWLAEGSVHNLGPPAAARSHPRFRRAHLGGA